MLKYDLNHNEEMLFLLFLQYSSKFVLSGKHFLILGSKIISY